VVVMPNVGPQRLVRKIEEARSGTIETTITATSSSTATSSTLSSLASTSASAGATTVDDLPLKQGWLSFGWRKGNARAKHMCVETC
jgi:hypothetical protein